MFYVSKICGVVSLSRYILCGDWSAFILAVDASSVVLGFVKGEVWEFEDDMLNMTPSTKFKQVSNPFLNKLKNDTELIRNEIKLLITADKTTSYYKLEPSTYNTLLEQTGFLPCVSESKIEKIPNCTNFAQRSQELSRFGEGGHSRKILNRCFVEIVEMSETLTLFNDEAKDNCPNTTYDPLF